MKIRIPGTSKIVYLRVNVVDYNIAVVGLNSGKNRGTNHYLLMDYDDNISLVQLELELKSLMQLDKIRRFMIIESSPGKYHAVSFTPRPFILMLGIMNGSSCDKKQAGFAMREGFATLRFTAKLGVKPKLIKELNNYDGKHFYNYDAEKAYLELIRGEDE